MLIAIRPRCSGISSGDESAQHVAEIRLMSAKQYERMQVPGVSVSLGLVSFLSLLHCIVTTSVHLLLQTGHSPPPHRTCSCPPSATPPVAIPVCGSSDSHFTRWLS